MADETLKVAQITVKSGAVLTIGRAISTLISFVFMIFVIKLLGEELYGLYRLVLIPISMAMLFCGFGIPPALTKYIALFKAEKKFYELKRVVISGFVFACFNGLMLTVVMFIFADFVAIFYQKPEVSPLIRIASLVLFSVAIYNVSWNVFLGFEDTKYNTVMLIINSVIKGSFAIVLVLFGYGVFGAIIGYLAGFFSSTILGIVFVIGKIKKSGSVGIGTLNVNYNLGWKDSLSLLLRFGFPLAIVNIIGGFGGQFYSFLAGRYCSEWDFGNYGAATLLLTPLPILSLPISAVMFPAYSKIDGVKENKLLSSVFKLSVKYYSLLIVPVAALVMGLSETLNIAIFGTSFPDAPLYLTLLSSIYLCTAIGYLNVGSLLKGQGFTTVVLITNIIGLSVGIPVSLLIIPSFGILGLIITNIVVSIVALVSNLIFVKKKFGFGIEWRCSVKILLAGGFAGVIAHFLQQWLDSYPIVKLVLGGIVGLCIYILIVLVSGAVTKKDVQNLRVIFRGILPFKRVFKPYAKKIEEILERILD